MRFVSLIVMACCFHALAFSQTVDPSRNPISLIPVKKIDSIRLTRVLPLWQRGGIGQLTYAQLAQSNWAAGGENSHAINWVVNLFANHSKGHNVWNNTLDIAYGMQKVGEKPMRKTDDKIDITSKYGHLISPKLYLSAIINVKTQFADGFKYDDSKGTQELISGFMSPGYFVFALGLDYKPTKSLSFVVAPPSIRVTVVRDDSLSAAGAFGVDKGKNIKYEAGSTVTASFKAEVMKNVVLQGKVNLFSNILDQPENVDVNMEAILAMKVNKYLSANLSTNLIYDDNVKIKNSDGTASAKLQSKEVFGVGISYKF